MTFYTTLTKIKMKTENIKIKPNLEYSQKLNYYMLVKQHCCTFKTSIYTFLLLYLANLCKPAQVTVSFIVY